MHYFRFIYFHSKPLYVSSRFAAHHQEGQFCTNSSWYSHALFWLDAEIEINKQKIVHVVGSCFADVPVQIYKTV